MMKNKKFFKWDIERNYPYPFNDFKGKRVNMKVEEAASGSIKTASVTIIPGLVEAMTYYSIRYGIEDGTLLPSDIAVPKHLQIGTGSTGTGDEEIFVEYGDEENIECVAYAPSSGVMRGCVYNLKQNVAKAYKLDGTARDFVPLGAAMWIALIHAYHGAPGFSKISKSITESHLAIIDACVSTFGSSPRQVPESAYEKTIGSLSYYFYSALSLEGTINLKIKDDDNQLKQIKKMELECGDVGPAYGKKVFSGEYKVFKDTRKAKKVNPSKVNFDKYKDYPWQKPLSEYSFTEQMLVPAEDPTFTPSEEFVRVLDYFYDSKDDGKDQIKQILLVGGPGGGKSTLGVMVGHYLGGGRPTLTFTCGSNYTSDELKGMLLPVPKDEVSGLTEKEQKLLEAVRGSSQEDILDNCAAALSYPTSFDCWFDPDGAYKQMSGEDRPEGVTESDVFSLMTGLVMSEQRSLSRKVESMAGKDVTYKYMPSGIVEAMTKGYFLVLDELTNMRDPAALSDLHEAFDVASSTRRIGTSTGDLFVHPDFRCITTANIGLEGNKRINQATLNRLGQVVISIEDIPKDQLIARAKNRTGVSDAKTLSECFDVYKRLKDGSEELRTPGVISPRDFFVFVKAISRGTDPETAIKELLLYKLTQGASKEDERELLDMIEDLPLLGD